MAEGPGLNAGVAKGIENAPVFKPVEKITSEQAANNILDFIQQRLAKDKANGATSEQLNSRLDQALQGFEKGFNEAKDLIEAMGYMTPQLADEISDTYDRVTTGIDELRDSINNAPQANSLSRLDVASSFSQTRSFSLSLTTQDGDRVSIEISRAIQSNQAASVNNAEDGFSYAAAREYSSSSSFLLNVTGELDEDELSAINNLLADVDELAQDFYAGNLDQAFQAATELDFNPEELSSLKLNLQQTTTVSAIAAYQSNSGAAPQAATKNVGDLLKQVDQLINEAEKFREPLKLIDDIISGLSLLDSVVENTQEDDQQNLSSETEALKNNLKSLIETVFDSSSISE